MKTKEELNALKEEVEALNRKLAELTEDELEQVSGGAYIKDIYDQVTYDLYYPGKGGSLTSNETGSDT